MSKVDIILRESEPKDMPFIYNSWLVSYYSGSGLDKTLNKDIYFSQHKLLIEKALRDGVICFVACLPDYENQILGWIAWDYKSHSIHYVYVKHPYRRLGIGNSLRQSLGFPIPRSIHPFFFTHYTRIAEILAPKWDLTYNPYYFIGDTNEPKNDTCEISELSKD